MPRQLRCGKPASSADFRRHLDNDIDNAADAITDKDAVISRQCGSLKGKLRHIEVDKATYPIPAETQKAII